MKNFLQRCLIIEKGFGERELNLNLKFIPYLKQQGEMQPSDFVRSLTIGYEERCFKIYIVLTPVLSVW
jgi:xanthine dehydrogenase iron-sulfur cluster and FAD-binding subunit A